MRGRKREIAERQKGDQRHIVCDQHRSDERHAHQRDHARSRVAEATYDRLRSEIEKVQIFQRANRGGYGKETGERFEIEIAEIFFIGRHDKRRDERQQKGDYAHGVFFQKAKEAFFILRGFGLRRGSAACRCGFLVVAMFGNDGVGSGCRIGGSGGNRRTYHKTK